MSFFRFPDVGYDNRTQAENNSHILTDNHNRFACICKLSLSIAAVDITRLCFFSHIMIDPLFDSVFLTFAAFRVGQAPPSLRSFGGATHSASLRAGPSLQLSSSRKRRPGIVDGDAGEDAAEAA